MNTYEELAGSSKVWVFLADRHLTDTEGAAITANWSIFADQWRSHGSPVKSFCKILYGRFIVLMADDQGEALCGRAVDASVQFIKELETKYSVSLLNRHLAAYLADGNRVQTCPLNDLASLIDKGILSPQSLVFNTLVSTKEEFERAWLVPLSSSWHRNFLTAL